MSDADKLAATGAGKIAWIGTIVVLAAYFVLMLAVAYVPAELGQPIAAGSAISIGLVAGLVVIALLMVASAAFTYWRNRSTDAP